MRRVAVLLGTLDDSAAGDLLARMPADWRASIEELMRSVDNVGPLERREVVEEFVGRLRKTTSVTNKRLATESSDHCQAGESLPFESLIRHISIGTLAELVADEHPQTYAVILSNLAPDRAAQLLQESTPDVRSDVLRRVLDLDEADDVAVDEIKQSLTQRIRACLAEQHRSSARLARVRAILGAADPALRRDLLGAIDAEQHELARSLTAAPRGGEARPDPAQTSVQFDRLVDYHEKMLADLFNAIPRDVAAVALSGASQPARKEILARMPEEIRAAVVQRMNSLGPVRVADIHVAQAIVLELLRKLAGRPAGGAVVSRRITLSA
jgi:flagellar motor switch protein FliG